MTHRIPKKRLTDEERRAINRQNGKKSRGPKTQLGLSRSSQNALRHGLAVAISHDPEASAAIDQLAVKIAGGNADQTRMSLCRQLAEAQLDLLRIRNVRTDIWADDTLRRVRTTRKELKAIRRFYKAKILAEPSYVDSLDLMDQWEHTLINVNRAPLPYERGVGLLISRLDALERYERRALSRRNRAIHDLADFDENRASGLAWP